MAGQMTRPARAALRRSCARSVGEGEVGVDVDVDVGVGVEGSADDGEVGDGDVEAIVGCR